MNPRWQFVRRIGVAFVLAGAFIVMASVFSPQRSKAGDPSVVDGANASETSSLAQSTNPHEGLRSLGSLESRGYVIHMYATSNPGSDAEGRGGTGGALYSVYEKSSGRDLGALMTPEHVQQWFPEVQLPTLDFSAPTGQPALMLAEPETFQQ